MRKTEFARKPGGTGAGRTSRLAPALCGFALGVMGGYLFQELTNGIRPQWDTDWLILLTGIAGAIAYPRRTRRWLWAAVGALVASLLVIGFTPIVPWLASGWIRADAPRREPVVVVLAAGSDQEGGIPWEGQQRLLRAYELIGQGMAPEMILSSGAGDAPSWTPAVRLQMRRLGLSRTVTVTPTVRTTHDEAITTAAICRERGWRSIILVTDPVHMKRAAALFEAEGLRVDAVPTIDPDKRIREATSVRQRLSLFHEWMHEAIGWAVYRRRGWL